MEKGGLLTDRYMFAGHVLLCRQFPELQGMQITLYSQQTEKFKSISGKGKLGYSQ